MTLAVKVGGKTWLHTIGSYAVDEVVDRWPGGCWSLKWSMDLAPGDRPPALRPGVLVEAFVGGAHWTGRLGEPDWEASTFEAEGLSREGESALALNLSGLTSNPGEAIFYAAARGAVSWGTLYSFTAVTDDPPEQAGYIHPLLDAYCNSIGRRWGVDQHRSVVVSADPTSPSLFLAPGLGDLGVSTSIQVTDLFVNYLRKDTLTVEQVRSPGFGSGVPQPLERVVSLVNLGPLTPAQAQGHADGILAKVGPHAALTGSVEATYGQVSRGGGTPVDLHRVRAGAMLRATGVRDPRTGAPHTDFVIGESTWFPSEGRVVLSPVDSVATDLAAVIESIGGEVIA